MRALVTGSAGFIGRHIVSRLYTEGCDVVGVDLRFLRGPQKWARHRLLVQDCRQFFHYEPCEFDLVFHCAASIGGRVGIDGSPLSIATNLSIDSEFFDWLVREKKQPERVVYFSSSAAYPVDLQQRNDYCLLSEHFINLSQFRLGRPDQTYGWAKLTGELLASHAVRAGVPVVIYRPFSGYGPGQSLDYPVPAILKRVADGESPLVVWGSGEQRRDFIHVDDVIDGVFGTMHKLQPGEALNLGTGEAHTFADVAVLAGYGGAFRFDRSKPEGVFYRVADTCKMRQYFTPKVILAEGIRRMMEK